MNTWRWNCCCRVCHFIKAFVTATLAPRKLTRLYFYQQYKKECYLFLEGFQLNVFRSFSLKVKGERKIKIPCKIKAKITLNLFWQNTVYCCTFWYVFWDAWGMFAALAFPLLLLGLLEALPPLWLLLTEQSSTDENPVITLMQAYGCF